MFSDEDVNQLIQCVGLWSSAFNEPALAGGGAPDQSFVLAARAIPFVHGETADSVGLLVMDLLALSRGSDFFEEGPIGCHSAGYHLVLDIAGDACRIESGDRTIEALEAEMATAGAGASIIDEIDTVCAQYPFAPACGDEPDPIDCLKTAVADFAHFFARAVDPPEEPCTFGACDLPDSTCDIVDEATCTGLGGTFQGIGTPCEIDDCTANSGGCCLGQSGCLGTVTSDECSAVGGVFNGFGTTCDNVSCGEPIPTVNLWGATIMTVLLLVTGTLLCRKRWENSPSEG